ncbi:MAG: ResB protein required for cytochrome C biosynthesis [Opitutia bacterium Tous-C1TDCM]|nr:MAG: ResB protein required for cytochrome C biosynthesis [Opitutae bacterium Tous-C1TDCM]
MNPHLCAVRDFFVSLRLTIALLVFSFVLVFAATLDQVNLGIWAVQAKYFRSFVIYAGFGGLAVPVFPGGYTIGGLLLANLTAAFVFRFKFTWRRSGMALSHAGLIVLLFGELFTGLWQRDYRMRLDQGETRNYSESFRSYELAVTDITDPDFDDVVAVPASRLAGRREVQHQKLPFRIQTLAYYPNSLLQMRPAGAPPPTGPGPVANRDIGQHIVAAPQPLVASPDELDLPAAFVELAGPAGALGTWLVSPQLAAPQEFTAAGRTWRIALRPERLYQPFRLTLLQFSHDRYPGTQIPKNFSSRVRLRSDDGHEDREVLIAMNEPLRHGGLAFYQSGFENNDRTTILQVVRNPSWLFPYIASGLMTLGLTLQFGIHLVGFVGSRAARTAARPGPAAPGAPAAQTAATRPTVPTCA